MEINKRIFIIILVLGYIFSGYSYAYVEENSDRWIESFLVVTETFDDNIILTNTDEKEDWITTVSPCLVIEPTNTRHDFKFEYRSDFQIFSDYNDENNNNHIITGEAGFNFNKISFRINNEFLYFEDRSGGENVDRIPRKKNNLSFFSTVYLSKLDVSLVYHYLLDDYRSDDGIGTFKGDNITYQDLDNDEHILEIETAFKLWPKTSLLFSGDYGLKVHDTGSKSDSKYFDILAGLRGEPTNKSSIEGKMGYRYQNYEDESEDFKSLVFKGNFIENFSSRDVLRVDFERTTYETNYKENSYYGMTFISLQYEHGFTHTLWGILQCSYQKNDYPTSTTEGTKTSTREDDIFINACGFKYDMPSGITAQVLYEYRVRESTFPVFDYNNNRISFSITGRF